MSCKGIGWLICLFVAVSLATVYSDPLSTKEWSTTESVREAGPGPGEDLGALLDAGDGAVVTLEAGGVLLETHRAVLAARSPALEALLANYSAEAGGRLSIPDMEGPVLHHLVAYLYTLRPSRLPPDTATQLLAAAHRFGLPALQADCERQVAAQLSVETAASAAVLAVKHSANQLRDAAVNFIKDHRIKVLATKGWADALENQPKEVAEVSRLLADRLAEICGSATMEEETPATMENRTTTTTPTNTTTTTTTTTTINTTTEAGTTTTMKAGTTTNTEAGTTTTTTTEAGTTTSMEAGTQASTQPHSDHNKTPTTTAPPGDACPTSPLDEATVSRIRSLHSEERPLALFKAARYGAVGDVRALLAVGADARARDGDGWTALHFAAGGGSVAATRCLLEAGARVDARATRPAPGMTPLHLAALEGHAAVVRLLLAASADPNVRDRVGITPLHWAALKGHAEAAAALLDGGADKGARDRGGDTPLDTAKEANQWRLFELIRQR